MAKRVKHFFQVFSGYLHFSFEKYLLRLLKTILLISKYCITFIFGYWYWCYLLIYWLTDSVILVCLRHVCTGGRGQVRMPCHTRRDQRTSLYHGISPSTFARSWGIWILITRLVWQVLYCWLIKPSPWDGVSIEAQNDLKLENFPSLPPKYWDYRHATRPRLNFIITFHCGRRSHGGGEIYYSLRCFKFLIEANRQVEWGFQKDIRKHLVGFIAHLCLFRRVWSVQ